MLSFFGVLLNQREKVIKVYLLQNTDELRDAIVETLLMLNPTGDAVSYFDAADGIVEVERRLSQVSLDFAWVLTVLLGR